MSKHFYSKGLFFYILLGFVAYYKVINLSFLSDDWGLLKAFDKYGWNAISHNFDIPVVFRPISFFLLNVIYEIWGITSTVPYHSFSIIIHSFNSWLVFVLFNGLNLQYKPAIADYRKPYAYFAGILFLLLPYQSEAVSWIAASADLLATMFCLLSFIFYLRHKFSTHLPDIIYSLFFFFCALLSKESSWFFPLLIGAYEVLNIFYAEKKGLKFPKKETRLLLGFLLCFSFYIMLRYFCLEAIFMVYGKAVHLNFDFFLIIHNYILYLAKFFLLYRLLPEEIRLLFKFLNNNPAFLILSLVLIVSLILFFKKRIKGILPHSLLIFSLMAFLLALLPVINLETSFLGDSQSDRYGYLPSVFYVILVASLMQFLFKKKKIFFAFVSLLMICFFYCLQQTNTNWQNAGKISQSVIRSFNKENDKFEQTLVYILNMPDNFNGAYLFRNGFKQAVSLVAETDCLAEIKIISYHNLNQADDSILVERRSTDEYFLKLQNPKNKFLPMNSFPSDDLYQIISLGSNGFVIKFKETQKDRKVFYYNKGQLKMG